MRWDPRSRIRTVTFALAATFMLVAFSSVAQAGVIYSTGFEDPPFVFGAISGQDSWSATGTAEIETFNTNGGAQALVMLGDAAGMRAARDTPVDGTTDPVVLIQTDLSVASGFTNTWSLLAMSGASSTLGGFDVLPDGSVRLKTAGTPIVGTATLDKWDSFALVFDFSSSTFALFQNLVLLSSGNPFLNPGTDIQAGVFTSETAEDGAALVDNYLVSTPDATVPEPGGQLLMAAGLSLAGLLRFLKRR
jgi:hypothetical protein